MIVDARWTLLVGDERTIAWVRPALGVPGLVDVETSTGETFGDLTMGQFSSLARERDWDVRTDR